MRELFRTLVLNSKHNKFNVQTFNNVKSISFVQLIVITENIGENRFLVYSDPPISL